MQAQLRISEPGDEYEREADLVAAQVMQMPGTGSGSNLRSAQGLVRRRLSGDAGILSRAALEESAPDQGPRSAEEGTQEEGSRCPSWRADPESISKRAAENYVQHDITPPSQAKVEKISCEPPIANGNYGCYVHFSDGLVIRVIVRETDIIVGMGPGPFTTETPPPATPLCFYDYHCPDGLLVLTKRECKSAKSSRPHPPGAPSAVVQRQVDSGQSAWACAPPMVQGVLASPGQPLDAATRAYFEPRFGFDFGKVRVHADTAASESAQTINALAYTVGSDIVFRSGQFEPQSQAGRRLLAHELTHVVQGFGPATRRKEVRRKGALSPGDKASVEAGKGRDEEKPMVPVDCAVEITPTHDCFALTAEMIAIQADMRENNRWLERYRNDEIPWDADAYTARARYQGELRVKFDAKERIRAACCPGQEVPGEAPTAVPGAAPAPLPQPDPPNLNGEGQ